MLHTAVFTAIDTPVQVDHQICQTAMMERFFPRGIVCDTTRNLAVERFYSEETRHDACLWNNVECTDGKVTAVTVSAVLEGVGIVVCADWLPPTTERVTLQCVLHASFLNVSRLPRELRILYVMQDRPRAMRETDFTRLPRKLEEFISYAGWHHGKIVLANLPPKMRILWMTIVPPPALYLDAANFPSSLCHFGVVNVNNRGSIKAYDLQGKPARKCMQSRKEQWAVYDASSDFGNFMRRVSARTADNFDYAPIYDVYEEAIG